MAPTPGLAVPPEVSRLVAELHRAVGEPSGAVRGALMSAPWVDVAVIGGGPAGAAAALRLARDGASVRLYERSHYERPRMGETLPPDRQSPAARPASTSGTGSPRFTPYPRTRPRVRGAARRWPNGPSCASVRKRLARRPSRIRRDACRGRSRCRGGSHAGGQRPIGATTRPDSGLRVRGGRSTRGPGQVGRRRNGPFGPDRAQPRREPRAARPTRLGGPGLRAAERDGGGGHVHRGEREPAGGTSPRCPTVVGSWPAHRTPVWPPPAH